MHYFIWMTAYNAQNSLRYIYVFYAQNSGPKKQCKQEWFDSNLPSIHPKEKG